MTNDNRPRVALLTAEQITALCDAADKIIDEWEAYSEEPAGWTRHELDALAAGRNTLAAAEPSEQCWHCGGKVREYDNGYECRDCGQPA